MCNFGAVTAVWGSVFCSAAAALSGQATAQTSFPSSLCLPGCSEATAVRGWQIELIVFSALLCTLLCLALGALGITSFRLWRARRSQARLADSLQSAAMLHQAAEARRLLSEQHLVVTETNFAALRERVRPIVDMDEEVRRLDLLLFGQRDEIEDLKKQYQQKRDLFERLAKEVAIFDDRLAFAEMGMYEPHFEFEDSERYKAAILAVREKQKQMIKKGAAAFSAKEWTVDGDRKRGKAMMDRNVRLTLRALNNECDAAVATVRWNNINAMEKRIERARDQINKLNESNSTLISAAFFDLKMQELRLTHEHREKLKQEREDQREAARLAREEQKLIRDVEEAQKDEERYQALLAKARAEAASAGSMQLTAFTDQIKLLERDLAQAQAKLQRAQALAERTKSGYVYIISNVGSFGENIIKIGLTRRVDPAERVRELSDASVPFKFDTHAIIYSEDAPKLERALHAEFDTVRVNTRNPRKEFFRASLFEIETALARLSPEAAFFRDVEAQEYRETLAARKRALVAQDNEPEPLRIPIAV
jgi:hypothetical protein